MRTFIPAGVVASIIDEHRTAGDDRLTASVVVYASDYINEVLDLSELETYTAEEVSEEEPDDVVPGQGMMLADDETCGYYRVEDVLDLCDDATSRLEVCEDIIYTADIFEIFDSYTDACEASFGEVYAMADTDTITGAMGYAVNLFVEDVARTGVETVVDLVRDAVENY